MDSTRAARLVVDAVVHAFGWSRQQVVEYLRTNTVMAELEIRSETDRCIEMPGPALSYVVGRLEIQRLRARAVRFMTGDRFHRTGLSVRLPGRGALRGRMPVVLKASPRQDDRTAQLLYPRRALPVGVDPGFNGSPVRRAMGWLQSCSRDG